MQLNRLIIQLILLNAIKLMGSGGAPTDGELSGGHWDERDELDEMQAEEASQATLATLGDSHYLHHHQQHHQPPHSIAKSSPQDKRKDDYYDYRHVVAEGVQKALDECREKLKWDPWNCPKKAFLDILDRNPVPANKELGLTRALIASGIVLALARSCSYGTNQLCGCSQSQALAARALAIAPSSSASSTPLSPTNIQASNLETSMESTPMSIEGSSKPSNLGNDSCSGSCNKFVWKGCDETVKFAFKVSKMYLEAQDQVQDEVSRRINAHNYEVGRLAVRRNMKKNCKCHGVSGSCQVNTCWTTVPDMSKVGNYLERQYRQAAKVGASSTTEDTNLQSLERELEAIQKDKLVFAEASPDYCYENPELGINGTLNRYCSRTKHRSDGQLVSRSERDSCDRLCTKCGYRVKRERFQSEKQCDCRFQYCCYIECKRCPHVEDTYRCVRHS